VLVQRVTEASVSVDTGEVARIGPGLLCLVGIQAADGADDLGWLARKLVNLRIFGDDAGLMNRCVVEIGGDVLAVSQFTLYASTRKGNRPSFTPAAAPEIARPLFERFVGEVSGLLGRPVAVGRFGAHMRVALVNDGPVTIWLDSQSRE
jgi:D-tyrosyl-tRNA(Tyr) deacylase